MALMSSAVAPASAMIFFNESLALSHHIWGSCSAQPALTAMMGASFSGKNAVAAHTPVSASTSDAFTEELPTSKPNKYLFAMLI